MEGQPAGERGGSSEPQAGAATVPGGAAKPSSHQGATSTRLRNVHFDHEKDQEALKDSTKRWLATLERAGKDAYFLQNSIKRLEKADPANVLQIAASQLELLAAYHLIAQAQSRRSFNWALVGSGIGLVFFVVAVGFAMGIGTAVTTVIPLLAGAIVEAVAGLVFYLYGRTTEQLSQFHSRLEVLQRYLLANSLCSALEGEERNKARAALIQEISRAHVVQKS
jgi:hypothetical protein